MKNFEKSKADKKQDKKAGFKGESSKADKKADKAAMKKWSKKK